MERKDELYHHGRDGQKWGVRNGPPYPLKGTGLAAYKAAEGKIAGDTARKIVNRISGEDKSTEPLFTKETVKMILKGAAITAATAALTKVFLNVGDSAYQAGESAVKKILSNHGKEKYVPLKMDFYEKV